MNNITDWLDIKNINPIYFYGYTSRTTFNLYKFDQNDIEGLNEIEDYISQVAYKIKEQVKDSGQRWDNKVVVEVRISNSADEVTSLYFGFYDCRISVGLGVRSETERISI